MCLIHRSAPKHSEENNYLGDHGLFPHFPQMPDFKILHISWVRKEKNSTGLTVSSQRFCKLLKTLSKIPLLPIASAMGPPVLSSQWRAYVWTLTETLVINNQPYFAASTRQNQLPFLTEITMSPKDSFWSVISSLYVCLSINTYDDGTCTVKWPECPST